MYLYVDGAVGPAVVVPDVVQTPQHVIHVPVCLWPAPPAGISAIVGVVIQLIDGHSGATLLPELSDNQRLVETKGAKVVLEVKNNQIGTAYVNQWNITNEILIINVSEVLMYQFL